MNEMTGPAAVAMATLLGITPEPKRPFQYEPLIEKRRTERDKSVRRKPKVRRRR